MSILITIAKDLAFTQMISAVALAEEEEETTFHLMDQSRPALFTQKKEPFILSPSDRVLKYKG